MSRLLSAAAAFVATVVGAALVVTAVVATPRLWLGGYVSEAGVASSGPATVYRLGVAGLALGQALFAVALWGSGPRWVRVVPLTVTLVAVDAVFGGVSAVVSCSPGCPLPPHETPTARDLVHGGASILAVGLLGLALLCIAVLWPPGPLARPSRVAAAVVVPLLAADGLAILIVGRGHVTGLLERASLLAAVAWTLVACALLLRTAPPSHPARRWRRARSADRSESRLTH
jgi:Protein of unknown function (DUF998)